MPLPRNHLCHCMLSASVALLLLPPKLACTYFEIFMEGSGLQGSGLSESQVKHCDSFVYISQYGPGTASLNVYVAASIVLHHYALWAGYKERSRTGGKFDLGEKPLRTAPRGGPSTPRLSSRQHLGCLSNAPLVCLLRIVLVSQL